MNPHQAGQAGGHNDTGSGGSSSGKYKPAEHGGMKGDGSKDKRVGTGGRLLFLSRPKDE